MTTQPSGMSVSAQQRPAATVSRRPLLEREWALGWLLLAPVLLVMAILVVWPFTTAVWIAFTDKSIGRDANWVGLANFSQVISSPRFLRSIQNSLIFTVAAIALKLVLGMAMAL